MPSVQTVTGLIPEDAAEAFRRALIAADHSPVGAIDALRAAAPLIVAAELERIARLSTVHSSDAMFDRHDRVRLLARAARLRNT